MLMDIKLLLFRPLDDFFSVLLPLFQQLLSPRHPYCLLPWKALMLRQRAHGLKVSLLGHPLHGPFLGFKSLTISVMDLMASSITSLVTFGPSHSHGLLPSVPPDHRLCLVRFLPDPVNSHLIDVLGSCNVQWLHSSLWLAGYHCLLPLAVMSVVADTAMLRCY